jgi:hypothetical protein
VRRTGKNTIEADGAQLNGKTGWKTDEFAAGNLLVCDFDNGLLQHNALFIAYKINSDFGQGAMTWLNGKYNESFVATYDSGGPALINGQIAGVAYSAAGFNGDPDYLPGTNSSFGEIGFHTRVSNRAAWYDQYVPPVVNSVVMGRQSAPFVEYTVPPGSGNQIRTVPVGGTNRITVHFSEDVAPTATVSVVGKESGTTYPITTSFLTARILRININAPIQRNGIPGDKLTPARRTSA